MANPAAWLCRLHHVVILSSLMMSMTSLSAQREFSADGLGRSSAEARWRRGLDYGYNLDHPEALAAFEEAIAIDPRDATAHRLAAATIWTRLLFHQGAVTVEDYLGQARSKGWHGGRLPPTSSRRSTNT